jgi:hypothetical protein
MKFNKVFLSSAELLLGFILLFSITNETKSQQLTDNVDISFGIKSWDPVHIKVDEKTGSAFSTPIRFTALNSTYYPFKLLIDFIIFENLSPKPSPREISISHGINNLFTLSIHVPGVGYGYRYSYGYWLSPSDEIINEEYPYLIPLKEGKMVNAKTNLSGKIYNSFIGNKNDTIYAMRRGLVTAVPRSETMDFRISKHDCLEILHDDGTFMIYHNLSKEKAFTSPGKIVLPGQPIGMFSDSLYVMVSLVKVSKTRNLLEAQPITYAIGGSGVVTFDELDSKKQSVHPWEVIAKELKSKELKNIEKK